MFGENSANCDGEYYSPKQNRGFLSALMAMQALGDPLAEPQEGRRQHHRNQTGWSSPSWPAPSSRAVLEVRHLKMELCLFELDRWDFLFGRNLRRVS